MKLQLKLSLLIITLYAISACKKDELQAQNSIQGRWNVVEITSLYADFSNSGLIQLKLFLNKVNWESLILKLTLLALTSLEMIRYLQETLLGT